MNKYKIMIIDDQIEERVEYLADFFTNAPLNQNKKLAEDLREEYKRRITVEFEVVYPNRYEILDEYVRDHKVDAYFLDVYLEINSKWTLGGALSAIYKHNPKAPIFMYSTDWKDKDVLQTVTEAFREHFQGKTASYFYDINDIHRIVKDFREAVDLEQIEEIRNERKFIKNMMMKAYGKTEKEPFSKNGDIAILHISDIQYGDKNTTKYNMNLWAEVVAQCKGLKKENIISGIDLLAITGDISMHGKSEELKAVKKDLEEKLLKKLWSKEFESKEYQERIIVVPGNHDYDLNFCTMDYLISENGSGEDDRKIDFDKASASLETHNRKKLNDYHAMGLTAYKDFAYHITGNPVYYQKKHLNYVENKYTSWNLRFICLNTCDGIIADKTNGVRIDNDELDEIVNDNYDDGCYTIVLSHHTPLLVPELKDEEKEDFQKNCSTLKNTCKVGLWLGGHSHVQREKVTKTTRQTVKIYEASTLSLQEEWDDEPNYEVQTIDGRTIKSRRGFQIIILKNDGKGSYKPKLIRYGFDEEGVAWQLNE